MYRNDHCFGCGIDNPMGLKLKVEQTDNHGVAAEFVSEKQHQGWPGVQHGGVTSALLDELSGYVPNYMGVVAMTASLNVSYRNPIHTGEHLRVTAHPTRITRRLIDVEAQIVAEDGTVKAESVAKMMVLNDEQREAAGLTRLERA